MFGEQSDPQVRQKNRDRRKYSEILSEPRSKSSSPEPCKRSVDDLMREFLNKAKERVSMQGASIIDKLRTLSSSRISEFTPILQSAAKQAASCMRDADPLTAVMQYAFGLATHILEQVDDALLRP